MKNIIHIFIIGTQVNKVIETLSHALSEDEMAVTQGIFWTEYTDFDNKNVSFDADEFIWKRKDIRYGKSHLWHQKYSLPCTKVLGFVACRVISKVLGIVVAEHSWGDLKTIKFGKHMLSSVMYQRNRVLFIHLPVWMQ